MESIKKMLPALANAFRRDWNPAMLGICKFINGHQVNNIPKKYAFEKDLAQVAVENPDFAQFFGHQNSSQDHLLKTRRTFAAR